jgi:hypothetical protein
MARVTVKVVIEQEQEIDDGCDACWKKDETARQSVMELTLNGKTWFLCEEHEKKWADQFTQILGDPGEGQ